MSADAARPISVVEHQQTLYTSRNPTRQWLHTSRRDWIIGAIRRHLPPEHRRALEIGPGSGVYLPVLAELFEEVVALDIEHAYLEAARIFARQHPGIRPVQADIAAGLTEQEAHDLVLCSEVVEHIPAAQVDVAIRNMVRLLRPGGVLVLSTPHRWSILEAVARVAISPAFLPITRAVYREPVIELGHINLMTRRQVEAKLRAAGLQIVEHHSSGCYVPLLAEFGGHRGLRLQQAFQNILRRSELGQTLLWTQFYVGRRP